MACTEPKKAWKYGQTKNGKQKLVFKRPQNVHPEPEVQMVPCGKCVSCKLAYSREWATRIVHEAQTSLVSCFLTLTYDEYHLPVDHSVSLREVQLFIKRLRKRISPQKIKFFGCGEYGEKKGHRPHYHIIILGYDFPDKTYWSKTDTGNINYRSDMLEKLWTKGYSTIGEVNFNSAAYVARYTLKKTKEKNGYEHVDTDTGEISEVKPEFITMSSGIGKDWWNKYKTDTKKDYLNVNYQKNKIPRYYDKQLEKENPELLKEIKDKRAIMAIQINEKDTESMKESRDKIKNVQNKMLYRGYENE